MRNTPEEELVSNTVMKMLYLGCNDEINKDFDIMAYEDSVFKLRELSASDSKLKVE